MINSLADTVTLNNQVKMPALGLGVFQIPNDQVSQVVTDAIISGYRAIDTAAIYGNEAGTGAGIKAGLAATGLSHQDLFITSKVWNNHLSYDETIAAFNDSLAKLGLDYLDLCLIHWPGKAAFKEAWLALEDLYKAGKIRAIGVSNFQIYHLKELVEFATVTPVLNQIELHPKLTQTQLRDYLASKDIKVQAWSPLMQGKLLTDPALTAIAAKHNKSVAQVILRWDLQQGILLNVKSVHKERMLQNADLFDFELDEADLKTINELNENLRVGPNPDEFDF
ncbi:aldo/keto reductase [Ligilactobacillus agilis]|uniref:aldo/keto reductase n=1 Tax=Ligilactobacillus agilis TaxID=1601 RepID=UPI00254D169C|nr:aldo/keto reductase [Ligilactobacillus agilis]MDK6809258.1 aldo/keto reductase [Ligilactobacillus agilis]